MTSADRPQVAGFRFFFFSNERREPPHTHVEQGERYAKFWLSPIGLARNEGFRANELTQLRRTVEEHQSLLQERRNEYFGD